jgi:hypothetical protein
MGSLETAKAWIVHSHRERGTALPAEGSVYNPKEQQLLDGFAASLPAQPRTGLFQIRSAGTDIMHAPQTVRTQRDHDLNDLMHAMLDHDRERIVITVSRRY